ncbi:hypothetical protein, partial [Shewanella algae]|uniref:hypothetical protein n=1 Tax=Shewanella algae TaxID=38313 RepID=UPI00313F0021
MKPRKIIEWLTALTVGVIIVVVAVNRGEFSLAAKAKFFFGSQAAADHIDLDHNAHLILAKMSLDEKIGQLMIPMANDTSLDGNGG